VVARRNIVTAVMAVLFVAGACCADVMPISRPDSDLQSHQDRQHSDQQRSSCSDTVLPTYGVDLDSLAVGPLLSAQADLQQAAEPQPLCILTDGHDSLSLCLYGLLGLGLCRAAPWTKKLSFGCIPEWYHEGVPFQIGHSVAISPDCLCSTVVCFVQPDGVGQDLTPQYRRGTIEPLWRRSQFIPTALASRGPPNLTGESIVA